MAKPTPMSIEFLDRNVPEAFSRKGEASGYVRWGLVGWWGVCSLLVGMAAQAQPGWEVAVLRYVYEQDRAAFQRWMQGADASAYPVWIAAPMVGGGVALFEGTSGQAALRLLLTEALALGVVSGLKPLVHRPRPYVAQPGVKARLKDQGARMQRVDPWSFPSGHATLSFAVLTAWGLSESRWYVWLPGTLWASSVALSRVWKGVHYPGDVLGGMLLGIAVGAGVHLAAPLLQDQNETTEALLLPLLHLKVRLE